MPVNNALLLQNITKTFPGVIALNNVSMEIRKGEVHALVGENGAGKSTLIKICAGAHTADSGTIVIDGVSYSKFTPHEAMKNGLSVIYQELNLVEELTVAENVFLGNPIRKGIFIDRAAMNKKASEVFRQLSISIDPTAKVSELTAGFKQMVEIAKSVVRDAKILIMDEPSSSLTTHEIESLFRLIDTLRTTGVSIIYISHRLEEIFRIADRVSVMRDGKMIRTAEVKDIDIDTLIRLMVGREMGKTFPERADMMRDEVLLSVKNLCGNGVSGINFEVRRGEVLGLAGLVGSGRTETAELIFGVAKREQGEILFKGKELSVENCGQAIKQGIVLVPEDRKKYGTLLHMSVRHNISIAKIKKLSKYGILKRRDEKNLVNSYIEKLQIKTPSPEQVVRNLSGGNQQKIVVAKWLAVDPELIIFDEPTRGIDVGAKFEIYTIIKQLVEEGKTIIVISSEMNELFGICDRLIVLADGRQTGEIAKEDFEQVLVLKYASGTSVA